MTRYLITSGTSQTGTAIIKSLRALGVPATDISAGSRDPKANEARLTSIGAGHVVHLDYGSEESIELALKGIDVVGLMTGALPLCENYRRVVSVAVRPGSSVKALVAMGGAMGGLDSEVIQDYARAEKLVLDEPLLETVVIAPNWFFENWKLPEAHTQLEAGVVRGAAGEGRIAYIAVQDIADVWAKILTSGTKQWNGQRIYITGSEALTEQEILTVVGETVYGKAITYKSLPFEDFNQFLLDSGTPEYLATLFTDLEKTKRGGYVSKVASHLVKLILGREPTSVQQWASEWAASQKQTGK